MITAAFFFVGKRGFSCTVHNAFFWLLFLLFLFAFGSSLRNDAKEVDDEWVKVVPSLLLLLTLLPSLPLDFQVDVDATGYRRR